MRFIKQGFDSESEKHLLMTIMVLDDVIPVPIN